MSTISVNNITDLNNAIEQVDGAPPMSAAAIESDTLAITRRALPPDQATSIADAINAGTQTEAQYVNGLLSQVADTTIPAVAVEASMYNAVGSSAEITTLVTQFLLPQIENATQLGLNPQVYASETLGLAFAFADENGGTAFANTFGPSNATMPATPAGDAAFAAAAATAIFGSAATAGTVPAILGWVNNWEAFYTAHGIPGVANATAAQIDLAARGAAWGDAVGVALANDLGPLPGQVINFLDDAAQETAVYSAPLASQPTHAPFEGGLRLAPNDTAIFPANKFPSSGPISSTDWHYPTGDASFFGNTQIRPSLPDASDGVMLLKFDTFNPPPGQPNAFFGTSAISNRTFNPATDGPLAFTVVAKYETNPDGTIQKGIIGGWMYLYSDGGDPNIHDEIDFEGMSNNPTQIQTNIYHNEPPGNGHPISYDFPNGPSNLATYHSYTIEWFTNKVIWLVDGHEVRTVTDPNLVPTQDMNLHSTIWTGFSDWPTSDYTVTFPVKDAANDSTYTIDVQSLTVTKITTQVETAATDANALSTVQPAGIHIGEFDLLA